MIFNTFNPNQDVVAGRTTRVASGLWPDGLTTLTQTNLRDDFYSLTSSANPSPSYGTSDYDVLRTMYYLNMYPGDDALRNNDPYFSIAYGNVNGNLGSGSFTTEVNNIRVSPTKAIYTQYKNQLLGTFDLTKRFSMLSGSNSVDAEDIWVFDFSAYKMKDRIDEGMFEITLTGVDGVTLKLIDNSPYVTQNQMVYQIVEGELANLPSPLEYKGLGLLYPTDGIIILNAKLVAEKLGLTDPNVGIGGYNYGASPPVVTGWPYNPGISSTEYTYNHKTLATSIEMGSFLMNVRKSEYVPARHYFVRVMNRDFNYSNNPTYVYDGSDGANPKGTIRNTDFIENPKTYITTVGLYNDTNELVAVAKLSRPAVKSFDSELLIKVRLDF